MLLESTIAKLDHEALIDKGSIQQVEHNVLHIENGTEIVIKHRERWEISLLPNAALAPEKSSSGGSCEQRGQWNMENYILDLKELEKQRGSIWEVPQLEKEATLVPWHDFEGMGSLKLKNIIK